MKKFAIFCKRNDYIARGNKTITLIGNHPLTLQAIVAKEEDPDHGGILNFFFPFCFVTEYVDTWKITFSNKLFAKVQSFSVEFFVIP